MTDAPPQNPNPPAVQESQAEKQRKRMDALLFQIESRADQLSILLEDTGVGFPRFLEVIRRAFIKNPDLIAADAGSVIEACINAATDGLLPDGREGAMVIYNVNLKRRKSDPDDWGKKANWQPMYGGLLKIAYSSGNFQSIECRVVYEGDAFEYDLGDQPFIRHRPKSRPAGTKQPVIVAAYAVAKTVNGGVFREVFEGADIDKVNKVSRATNGPGANWPEEMARKGPLRRMWKFLPKNDAMNRIVERDNEGFDLGALEDAAEAPVRDRSLKPGFAAQPALEQGADAPMPEMTMPPMEEGELVGERTTYAPPKSYEAQGTGPDSGAAAHERQGREAAEVVGSPEVADFEAALTAAGTWKAVRGVVEAFCGTEMGSHDWAARGARSRAWARMLELRDAGKDKTDFIADPLLFECWILGANPTRDDVEGNWAILQEDKSFAKLGAADLARITALVAETLEVDDDDGGG